MATTAEFRAAVRALPKGEAACEADAVSVGGYRVWRVRLYAEPGQVRRFAWKWIYYVSHPDYEWPHFGGVSSVADLIDCVRSYERRRNRGVA